MQNVYIHKFQWADGYRNIYYAISSSQTNIAISVLHLYILHTWGHYSGTLRLCPHTPHKVLLLWTCLNGQDVWVSCTQWEQQGLAPLAPSQSFLPVGLSSVPAWKMESTTPLCCTGDSSADWSSTMARAWIAPLWSTACLDSCRKTRPPGPEAEGCSALPEYLKEEETVAGCQFTHAVELQSSS